MAESKPVMAEHKPVMAANHNTAAKELMKSKYFKSSKDSPPAKLPTKSPMLLMYFWQGGMLEAAC